MRSIWGGFFFSSVLYTVFGKCKKEQVERQKEGGGAREGRREGPGGGGILDNPG